MSLQGGERVAYPLPAGLPEMFRFIPSYSWGDRTRAILTPQAQAWSHPVRHPGVLETLRAHRCETGGGPT